MSRILPVTLLALAGLSSVAPAQPPVVVPPPPPAVVVPPAPVPAPGVFPPAPLAPMPNPLPPGAVLPSSVLTPAPPMTHQEFARIFKPLPGKYEVVFIHPGSHRPVNVCFTLPAGCPQVIVRHRDLVFDYGHHHEVRIRFALFGKVRVTMQ